MADLSLNDILQEEILESLQGSEIKLLKAVNDLSTKVKKGSDRVTIPNLVGLALSDITAGTRAAADSVSVESSTLLLNQSKKVHRYISWQDDKDSAVDLKQSFLDVAPKVIAEGMEKIIGTKLATACANDFDSASATAGVFTIADIAKAKRLMDQAKIPSTDRYMALNSEALELLSQMTEFTDYSKSNSTEALREGVVGRVKGFDVICTEDVGGVGAANKIHFFHRSAISFAIHSNVEYAEQKDEAYSQTYVAVRAKYGCIDNDNTAGDGKRKLTMSMTTATA